MVNTRRLSAPAAARLAPAYLVGPRVLGQYEEAVADYDQAIRLQPDYTDFYIFRSNAKAELGQHREAGADLEAALELAREAGDSKLISFIEGKIEELEQEE